MKHFISGICLTALIFSCSQTKKQESNNHISLNDSQALYNFYHYGTDRVTPIVQGHRGTIEDGMPESCIASMEYVLDRIPAVFEIDPRLTKDSVVVVFHDATLDRTTNGTGKLIDYTWEEMQVFRLKNAKGDLTAYRINTLAEVLEWARGKTALILDKKDVPFGMIAELIRKHNANSYVMNMVRSTEEALFYFNENPARMFSASVRRPDVFQQYMDAGIPKNQLFACIGTELTDETPALCAFLRQNGVRSLLATASTYDKLESPEARAEAYRKIIAAGVTIIESNYPLEVARAILDQPEQRK